MRVYKFRGETSDGKFVYGDYSSISRPAIVNKSGIYPVNPDSVVLQVGYDLNYTENNEIYEHDVVANTSHNGLTYCGEPLSAELVPCLRDKYGKTYFSKDVIKWNI